MFTPNATVDFSEEIREHVGHDQLIRASGRDRALGLLLPANHARGDKVQGRC